MKKIFIILSIIISILIINKEYNDIKIPDNAIRIRIIANSNNIEDQYEKYKVKTKIENMLYKKLNNTKDINKARNTIKNNLKEIDNILDNTTNSKYSINYGINYFPEKEFHGIKYNEGNYESLVIKLGESKGINWWCVLFPPLCLVSTKDNNKDNIEYKLTIRHTKPKSKGIRNIEFTRKRSIPENLKAKSKSLFEKASWRIEIYGLLPRIKLIIAIEKSIKVHSNTVPFRKDKVLYSQKTYTRNKII